MTEARLVVGCGYLGHRVARRWQVEGRTVFATTRSPNRAGQFEAEGLRPLVADVTRPETLAALPAAGTVLYAVGYDRHGALARNRVQVEGLRAVLDALPDSTGKIVYVSTTGVYGEADSDWVDEDSPCRPTREAGRIALAAEEVLRGHRLGARAIILRLAGIYGPGRIPRIADVLAGAPLEVPSRAQANLIHVDDAVSAVLAADARAQPPRTYNVADGCPASRREFYRLVASLLGVEGVTFVEPKDDPGSSRGAGKKVDNRRLLDELQVELAFPTYRDGLPAVVGGQPNHLDRPA